MIATLDDVTAKKKRPEPTAEEVAARELLRRARSARAARSAQARPRDGLRGISVSAVYTLERNLCHRSLFVRRRVNAATASSVGCH